MEPSSIIIGPNNPDFSLHSHSCSCSPTFLKPNDGLRLSAPQLEVSGIEMIVVPTVSYTSLRDIMPHPNNASWNEIPIKNPLLKQAALAYLQPMSTPPEVLGNKGWFEKLTEKCFCFCGGGGRGREGGLGCFGWLIGGGFFKTLLEAFVGCFCERRRIGNGEEEYQQHEDDDDNEEEVNVD